MRKPIIENVDKWTNHYESMAKGKIPFEDMYVLNQKGRGLGNHKRSRIIYKIQKTNNSSVSSPQIISPVAQGINQVESMVKQRKKCIKTKPKRRRNQSKRSNRTKRKTKGKVTKRRRKKTIKKRKKDIFG